MIIREYNPKDSARIKELAGKYKLNIPPDGKIIVAESKGGKIEGFVSVRLILFVEPMVSENPIAAVRLWKYIEERMKKGGVKIVRCFAQPKHEKTYKKIGFYRIFKKYLPMEKNLYEV